jgi:light-independent protochlorophyllide reductase subunit B
MEDHLLEIFGGHDTKLVETTKQSDVEWSSDAQIELGRIPGFVRQKVRRNTEIFATTVQSTAVITPEVMFQAKEHWSSHALPENHIVGG